MRKVGIERGFSASRAASIRASSRSSRPRRSARRTCSASACPTRRRARQPRARRGGRRATGIETMTVEITAQVDVYFERFPGCRRAPARQQDGARADDDPLRSLGALARLRARHEQQDGAAARLRHAHGDMASAVNPLGDLYKTQVWALAEPSACRSDRRARTLRRTCGQARPTKASWASPTGRSISSLYLMVDQRYTKNGAHRRRVPRAFHRDVAHAS